MCGKWIAINKKVISSMGQNKKLVNAYQHMHTNTADVKMNVKFFVYTVILIIGFY